MDLKQNKANVRNFGVFYFLLGTVLFLGKWLAWNESAWGVVVFIFAMATLFLNPLDKVKAWSVGRRLSAFFIIAVTFYLGSLLVGFDFMISFASVLICLSGLYLIIQSK